MWFGYNSDPSPCGREGVGGHIVFSVDPVGICIGVATCLHSISLLNGQILAKLYSNISLGGGKMLIRFW